MFGVVLLTTATVLQLYVFWRASSVPWIRARVPRQVLLGTGLGTWTVLVSGRLLDDVAGGFGRGLELVGLSWLAILFLGFTCLLLVELATGFGFLFRSRAPAARGFALGAAGLLSAVALVQGLRPPVVETFEITLPRLPAHLDGTVVLGLSDLHIGPSIGPRWLGARVDEVLASRPDLVVLLGDVLEGGHGDDGDTIVAELRRLRAPLGVLAVAGNHEHYGREDSTIGLYADAGIELLHDRWVEVTPGLVVAGVQDLTIHRRRGGGEDPMVTALAGRPSGATLLLSHTPDLVETAARLGADLMLSGHTHAGQIWPFGYLVRLRHPLVEGEHRVGGMTALVSRGAGTWGPRMRLWRPGQLLRVVLRAPDGAPRAGSDTAAR